MLNYDVWCRVTPLEFKSSFAHFWRSGEDSEWYVKFRDFDSNVNLKVDSLKDAVIKVEKLHLNKTYLPKPKKVSSIKKKRKPKKDAPTSTNNIKSRKSRKG